MIEYLYFKGGRQEIDLGRANDDGWCSRPKIYSRLFQSEPHLKIELDSMQDYFTATCPQVLDYKADGNAVENLQIPMMSTATALPKSESSYIFLPTPL